MQSDENFTGSCKNTAIAELEKHWGCSKVLGTLTGGFPGHFQKKMMRTVPTFKLLTS